MNGTAVAASAAPPHLLLEPEHATPAVLPFLGGTAAVYSRRSPAKESPNEDAGALVDIGGGRGAIVVADGCGGMPAAAEAARRAVDAVCEVVGELRDAPEEDALDGRLRVAIMDAFERANDRVRALGVGAATTLAVVGVDGRRIRPYHAGDSQILQVGGRGKLKLRTRSHSPVGYALAAGLLSPEDALHHEDRHLVSNVIGDEEVHVEVGSRTTLAARDTLLVASDGLFDNLHLEEIGERIRKGSLADAARALVEEIDRRMAGEADEELPSKPDDLTFVLYRPRR